MNNSNNAIKVPVSIFLLALLAIPFAFAVANVKAFHDDPGTILLVGLGALAVPGVIAYFFVFKHQPDHVRRDPFLYIFTIFSFACVLDLLIGLDLQGVTDVMSWYFSSGEPYLNTAHGMAINLWDGTVHFGLYLFLAFALAAGIGYRRAGLFWVGSIMASGMVFLIGNLIGAFAEHVEPSYLLNVPFMLVPIFLAWRIFQQQSPAANTTNQLNSAVKWLLTLALLAGSALCFYRLLVVINPDVSLTSPWLGREPYLVSQEAYPKMQMLVYGFWLAPFLIVCALSVWRPGSAMVSNWAWIMAGAVAQGQFSHLLASTSSITQGSFPLVQGELGNVVLLNLFLPAILFAFVLSYDRALLRQ